MHRNANHRRRDTCHALCNIQAACRQTLISVSWNEGCTGLRQLHVERYCRDRGGRDAPHSKPQSQVLHSTEMPIDDAARALKQQFQLEDLSKSPVLEKLASIASAFPLPYPFDKLVEKIKGRLTSDAQERIELMLEACIDETNRQAARAGNLQTRMDEKEAQNRRDVLSELVIDAARKAENTRSKERVKRVGTILANAAFETKPTDADEIEEMMRVAMELGDGDVEFLRELVKVEGEAVLTKGPGDKGEERRSYSARRAVTKRRPFG